MVSRNKIQQKYKWDLSVIFSNEKEYLNFINDIKFDDILSFKEKLNTKEAIFECLKLFYDKYKDIAKAYTYANLIVSEDVSSSNSNKNKMLIEDKYSTFLSATSFIEPELLKQNNKFLNELISDEKFVDYNVYLKNLLRQKEHILSEKEENILARVSSFSGGFDDIQSALENADLKFNDVILDSGKKIKLNGLNYTTLLSTLKENDRKKVYEEYYKTFNNHLNTFATNYIFSVKKDCFYSSVRHFDSAMEASLFSEEVDPIVYENLISCINKNVSLMHKYYRYKAKEMGKTKLSFWDVYLKDKAVNKDISFEEALTLVENATKNLGKDYTAYLKSCFTNRWVDVFPSTNKRGGAFCSDVYGISPFVLLNYNNKLEDVFTVAHELGHAMHSHYSMTNLPFTKYDYTIFVAEVASTVNELLLLKYLKENAKTKSEKLYYSKHYIDSFRTTVFRQTMFSEFEKIIHEHVENNTGISKDVLCDEYLKLVKKYHGKHFDYDKFIRLEWARIPHFFTAFYVYKYATGLITASILSEKIYNNDKIAIEKYKNFLKSGGTKNPVELLKEAGVDLTDSSNLNYAMDILKNNIDEYIKIINKK